MASLSMAEPVATSQENPMDLTILPRNSRKCNSFFTKLSQKVGIFFLHARIGVLPAGESLQTPFSPKSPDSLYLPNE
jgi:hypothetical protein